MRRILVVEDERAQRNACVRALTRQGFVVDDAESAELALEKLQTSSYSAVVSDLQLPSMDGIEFVRRALEIDEELGALIITGNASLETAVEALRAGAHDYILKPLFYEELGRKLDSLIEHKRLIAENTSLRRALRASETEVIGVSAAMQDVFMWIDRAAGTDSIVLITGETGTGKEVVARAIHERGGRAEEPMLAVNVASLPDTMVESELFGHERGAFTGAEKRREGILRAAGSGTVLLDEIGELSLPLQAKLLRALEAHEILPVGRDIPVSFDARILCATHRDLQKMIADGKFREDLYYRLNVIHIDLPPLRERIDDIPPLVHHIVERHAKRRGGPPCVVTGDAMRVLCCYEWPGNVRELSNVLERAMILADECRIDVAQLPRDFFRSDEQPSLLLEDAVTAFERSHIALVLRLCDGSRERAAQELGLSPATLYRKIAKYGLKGFLTPKASDA